MNLWVLPIEGHEQRYTNEWRQHLPEQLRHAAEDRDIPATVIEVDGELPDQTTSPGAFLDFAATNVFKSTQIAEVARRFQRGEVEPGDVFVLADAWHPGVHQIRYMSQLLNVPVSMVGLWHAGSYDPHDFLGRIEDQRWSRSMERALFEAYDVSAFATQAHIDLFRKGLGISKDDTRLALCGWPMEYLPALLAPQLGAAKRNLVLFPHRIAPEKQVVIFEDLASSFPGWEFLACQREALSKEAYHDLLGEARVVFSCSLQETLGIGCYEGVLAGAVPVVPDRLSYREMYPKEFRYRSSWTQSLKDYEQNKSALVAHLKKVIAKIEAGKADLSSCRSQMASFFSGEALYNWIFLYQR